MKKKVALLMALSMLLSLTACNDSESSGSSKDSSSEVTTEKDTAETTTAETDAVPEIINTEPEYPKPVIDENAITFNDSKDVYTAHCAADKQFENDESKCYISVGEYKGEKQLKIEVLDKGDDDKYKVPKIVFDVDALVGSENLSKIKSFSVDITQVAVDEFVADDGTEILVPGNLMGSFGTVVGENCDEWYEPTGSAHEFASEEWSFEWEYLHVEGKMLLKGFVDGTTGASLMFMRWGIPNQADIYLDNLTFYDEEGKSIPIVYTPGQADSGETATEETVTEEEVTEA